MLPHSVGRGPCAHSIEIKKQNEYMELTSTMDLISRETNWGKKSRGEKVHENTQAREGPVRGCGEGGLGRGQSDSLQGSRRGESLDKVGWSNWIVFMFFPF